MQLSGYNYAQQIVTRIRKATQLADPGQLMIVLALLAVYLIWGSTYLAVRVAVETIPPFQMGGSRFVVAGAGLYLFLRARGAPAPTRSQWAGSALIGGLLLVGGMGLVSFAEQWVPSGLAALAVAAVPLWASLFAGLWGRWPLRLEWLGLGLGFAGVVLLNLEGDLRANFLGALALVIAPISWSFGSILSRRVSLPAGLMGSATEMLAGGCLMLLASLLLGERLVDVPSLRSIGAWGYQVIFGSLFGFTAYMFLLGRVRLALATSYAYVNPLVALFLGWALAGESITARTLVAAAIIVTGVVIITTSRPNGSQGAKSGEKLNTEH